VDWNSTDSQELRFERLLTAIDDRSMVRLNDYGCGYGALADYLDRAGFDLQYHGFDISHSMIAAANELHRHLDWCSFTSDLTTLKPAEYTVASGIFNVKLRHAAELWQEYVFATLRMLDALTTRAFAFNMLSTYSDQSKRREDLFYTDPLVMFDFCKRQLSPGVALLHDYPLYEFTVVVRK
jgi:trans-aconitate methyltransferase